MLAYDKTQDDWHSDFLFLHHWIFRLCIFADAIRVEPNCFAIIGTDDCGWDPRCDILDWIHDGNNKVVTFFNSI